MNGLIRFAGQDLIILSVLITAYFVFKLPRKNLKKFLFVLLASCILSLVLAKVGHHLYDNPRPFITDHTAALYDSSIDNGFPSDHTLLAAVLGFVVIAFSRRA